MKDKLWKCLFVHRWTKWITVTAKQTHTHFPTPITVNADVQVRKCERCGLQEVRRI